jgi:hypothetical protein
MRKVSDKEREELSAEIAGLDKPATRRLLERVCGELGLV